MVQMNDKLDSLFRAYREAVPDPEAGPDFMPGLWRRIESQRAMSSSWLFRWLEVCLAGTLAVGLLLGFYAIPKFQESATTTHASYVDVLADADSALDASLVTVLAVSDGEGR